MTSATLATGSGFVRLLQVADRADAGRIAAAWAARSTTSEQAELILLDGMPDPARRTPATTSSSVAEMIRRYVGADRRPRLRAVHQLRR